MIPVTIGAKHFRCKDDAEDFFDEIRITYFESKEEILPPSEYFPLLSDLFTRYCQAEPGDNKKYALPGEILSFYVKYKPTGNKSGGGGTRPCFWAKFENGVEDRPFSALKAIKAITKKLDS